jgi:hypothetical protein
MSDSPSDDFLVRLDNERKRMRSTNLFFIEIVLWEGVRSAVLLGVIKAIEVFAKIIQYENEIIFSFIDNFGVAIGLILWAVLSVFFLRRHWKTIKGD